VSIWFAIPSRREFVEAQTCFQAWKRRGYRTAAFIDPGWIRPRVALLIEADYPGYAASVNRLCRAILAIDPTCTAVIAGGDDVFPVESRTAAELEADFKGRFPSLLGIMQPTGDGFDCNDRCLISQWLGRAYIRRGYGGKGPLCEAYPHFHVDRELSDVAGRLGIAWRRPDLSQPHRHWTVLGTEPPPFMARWRKRIGADGHLYEQRKRAGFPGSELAPG
jgi:hypothetical protein